MTKKVLHLIATMGGGGAERQLAYIAGALPREGWSVHVGLLRDGVHFHRLLRGGATVHRMHVNNNYDPRLLMEIHRVIKEVKPDVVQTWLPQMDVAGGLVASSRGIPWVVSERISRARQLGFMKSKLRVAKTRRATAVVSNSRAGIDYWSAVRPRVPHIYIPNALPYDEIAAVPPADLAAIRDGGKVILAAGRFVEQKNFDTLLDALCLVMREVNAIAVVCGTGPDEKSLREQIVAARLSDRVILPGFLEDIWSWMKSVDVFVSLSHYEGRPNTVIEAAACGTPLVVSDIPEHREFLDERSARLVDRKDPRAAADAILDVLQKRDEAVARAQAACETVRQWTIPDIAAQYAAVYRQITS